MRGCSPRQKGGHRQNRDSESRRVADDGALRGSNREHEQRRAKLRGKIWSGEVLYHVNVLYGLLNSIAGRRKAYTTTAPPAGRLDVSLLSLCDDLGEKNRSRGRKTGSALP
jgi:hypothetical protein